MSHGIINEETYAAAEAELLAVARRHAGANANALLVTVAIGELSRAGLSVDQILELLGGMVCQTFGGQRPSTKEVARA